jgi:Immunity protein 39
MRHDRKLVISDVALVKGRFKSVGPAIDSIRDELEKLLIESDFLDQAPFRWIGLIIRLGLMDHWTPEYQRINKKYGDLPIAIEVDVSELVDADAETIRASFRAASLEALIHVGNKYSLPVQPLMAARQAISPSLN